jgi:hypothetical protein
MYRFHPRTFLARFRIDQLVLSPFQRFICLENDILTIGKIPEVTQWIRKREQTTFYTTYTHTFNAFAIDSGFHSLGQVLFSYYRLLFKKKIFSRGLPCIIGIADKSNVDLRSMDRAVQLFADIDFMHFHDLSDYLITIGISHTKQVVLNPVKYLNHITINNFLGGAFSYKTRVYPDTALIHFIEKSKSIYWRYAIPLLIKTKFFRSE